MSGLPVDEVDIAPEDEVALEALTVAPVVAPPAPLVDALAEGPEPAPEWLVEPALGAPFAVEPPEPVAR